MASKINELEMVLLDQIEKLQDESIGADAEQTKLIIDRSKAMSDLAGNYIQIQQMKLDAVKEFNKNGNLYADYLGLEDKKKVKKSVSQQNLD